MKLYIYEDYKEIFPEHHGRKLTDMMIKKALREHGITEAEILRTEKGKPYVSIPGAVNGKNSSSQPDDGGDSALETKRDLVCNEIYISVSHSGRYFVCVISDAPVGVDVQEARSVKAMNIAGRYFTAEEIKYIEETGDEGFFLIWTRKEAYSKYTGLGLEEIMKGTDVLNRNDVKFTDFMMEKGIYCSCCTI